MAKIKPIRDPEFPEEPVHEMPAKMKMKNLKIMENKSGANREVAVPNNATDNSVKDMERVFDQNMTIDMTSLFQTIMSSELEAVNNNKAFIIKSSAKKLSCGPVLQRIKTGGYARIGDGQSVANDKAPIATKPNPIFKFDRDKQLALKVGDNVGRDYVVMVAANGCVALDSAAFASFQMPVFVVEQSGDYYQAKSGTRILLLGPGHHLVLYTEQSPILFLRKDTQTRKQSIIQIPGSESKSLKQEKTGSVGGSKEEKKKSEDSANTTLQPNVPPDNSEALMILPSPPKNKAVPPATQDSPKSAPASPSQSQPPPPPSASSQVPEKNEDINFGKPIAQNNGQTAPEPELRVERRRTVIKFILLLLLFLVLLTLFLRYRRKGSNGQPMPDNQSKNSTAKVEQRQ